MAHGWRIYHTSIYPKLTHLVVLVFDPPRTMRNDKTKETTPSLTFMPRAMEFESYTDEELWRTADPGETYLDPPPPVLTRKQQRQEEKRQRKNRPRDVKGNEDERLAAAGVNKEDHNSDYIDSSDSEYDVEHQTKLRNIYKTRQSYVRDRDFARKYSLSTMDLMSRYLTNISPTELCQDGSAIPSILTRLFLDDLWQLLAELRLMQDHIDSDLGADLHMHLLQDAGTVTRQNMAWIRSTLQELLEWTDHAKKSEILDFSEELVELSEELVSLKSRSEQTLNFLIASTGITQSALVIDQTSGINKLTELAFFFVPLSFITAVFSMQVAELTDAPPSIWTWGLSLAVVFLVTYLIRIFLRSPSVKDRTKTARVTILNRWTPKTRSSSLRLDSISNRAICKFILAFIVVLTCVCVVVAVFLIFAFLLYFGLWAGIAGTALYFIITKWPEAAVLAPCFVAICISAVGFGAVCYWNNIIGRYLEELLLDGAGDWLMSLLPEKWGTDLVDDEDLDREGVKTYARQRILFPSN